MLKAASENWADFQKLKWPSFLNGKNYVRIISLFFFLRCTYQLGVMKTDSPPDFINYLHFMFWAFVTNFGLAFSTTRLGVKLKWLTLVLILPVLFEVLCVNLGHDFLNLLGLLIVPYAIYRMFSEGRN